MNKIKLCAATIVLTLALAVGVMAANDGMWSWGINSILNQPALTYTGLAGSLTPITLTGFIKNTDTVNSLSFDGVVLKGDDLPANDPIFTYWTTDPSVDVPAAFIVAGSGSQNIPNVGTFSLANTPVGVYQFRLKASGSFDTVAASPDEFVTGWLTVNVVPEPMSAMALMAGISGMWAMRFRKT